MILNVAKISLQYHENVSHRQDNNENVIKKMLNHMT